jgi:hypothetical protein
LGSIRANRLPERTRTDFQAAAPMIFDVAV